MSEGIIVFHQATELDGIKRHGRSLSHLILHAAVLEPLVQSLKCHDAILCCGGRKLLRTTWTRGKRVTGGGPSEQIVAHFNSIGDMQRSHPDVVYRNSKWRHAIARQEGCRFSDYLKLVFHEKLDAKWVDLVARRSRPQRGWTVKVVLTLPPRSALRPSGPRTTPARVSSSAPSLTIAHDGCCSSRGVI